MSSPIKHRCPSCKKKRGDPDRLPPGDVADDDVEAQYVRRKKWKVVDGVRICGWCVERMHPMPPS